MEAVAALVDMLASHPTETLAALIIVGFVTGFLVWGPQHKEIKEDRDFWRNLYLGDMDLTERAVRAAGKRR